MTSTSPLVVNVQGQDIEGAGILGSYLPYEGDVVALLGQSSSAGADPTTWLVLGNVAQEESTRVTSTARAVASSNLNLTSVEQAVPGTLITFDTVRPNSVLLAWWSADFDVIANTITLGLCRLKLDGVASPSEAIYEMQSATNNGRVTTAQNERMVIANTGSHTAELFGIRSGGLDNQIRLSQTHTTLSIMILG